MLLHIFQYFKAIHDRHYHIQKNQNDIMVLLNLSYCLRPVPGLQQLILVLIVMEHFHEYHTVNFFVINDQYLLLLHVSTIILSIFATKS